MAAAVMLVPVFPSVASAKVFASQKQALEDAFPEASRIERITRVLRPGEVERIEAITHEKQPAKIVVIHSAYKDDVLLGHAQIDVHIVRTQPEAFMIVISPTGDVENVRILAFHEPLDYLPAGRWYEQFVGRTRGDDLRVGHDVVGVVGATLSARAAADGVRRMLAYWEVLLKPAVGQSEGEK